MLQPPYRASATATKKRTDRNVPIPVRADLAAGSISASIVVPRMAGIGAERPKQPITPTYRSWPEADLPNDFESRTKGSAFNPTGTIAVSMVHLDGHTAFHISENQTWKARTALFLIRHKDIFTFDRTN